MLPGDPLRLLSAKAGAWRSLSKYVYAARGPRGLAAVTSTLRRPLSLGAQRLPDVEDGTPSRSRRSAGHLLEESRTCRPG